MLKDFFFWRSWASEIIGSLVTKEQKHLQEKLLEAGFPLKDKLFWSCLFFLKGEEFVQSDPATDEMFCKIWVGKHN